jgi:transcriptional regulator with XRE-family HTH domain
MYNKSYSEKPDPEILQELGRRLRGLRGDRSQEETAALAGLSRQTVARAEHGDNPTLLTIVRLLRVYGRLGALDAFIPEPEVSPMQWLRERRLTEPEADLAAPEEGAPADG